MVAERLQLRPTYAQEAWQGNITASLSTFEVVTARANNIRLICAGQKQWLLYVPCSVFVVAM
jgi:hypothetical protein